MYIIDCTIVNFCLRPLNVDFGPGIWTRISDPDSNQGLLTQISDQGRRVPTRIPIQGLLTPDTKYKFFQYKSPFHAIVPSY
jgi:hypothetical protein